MITGNDLWTIHMRVCGDRFLNLLCEYN